jgi:O-antigen chain-terminating methyltransferase
MLPFYRAFEDKHRGSHETIKERLQIYLPFINPLKAIYPDCPALDIGCGRGEWLETLLENGFQALGVDLDDGMLQACRARDLPAVKAEALAYLKELPSDSLAVLTGFHIAEHILFDDLKELVSEAKRVLKPAGLLILETPNAENLIVGTQNFYLDPTHERPIPYMLLEFLMEFSGFERTKLLRLQENPGLAEFERLALMDVLAGTSPDYAMVGQKSPGDIDMAAFDIAFDGEYGLSLDDLAKRYDSTFVKHELELKNRLEEREAAQSQSMHRIAALELREQSVNDRLSALERLEWVISERLISLESERGPWHTELASHQAQHSIDSGELLARLAYLEQDSASLVQQYEEAQEELKAQIQNLEQLNTSLQKQLNASLGNAHNWYVEAEARQLKITQAHEDIAQLRVNLGMLHAQSEQLIGQISALRTSTSWRITAPLRAVTGGVRAAVISPLRSGKAAVRTAIKSTSNVTLKSPRLRRVIKNMLARYPKLSERIRGIILSKAVEPPVTTPIPHGNYYAAIDHSVSNAFVIEPPSHLTQNAKRLYVKLNSTDQQKDLK